MSKKKETKITDKERIDYLELHQLKRLDLTMDGKSTWYLGLLGRHIASNLREVIDIKIKSRL